MVGYHYVVDLQGNVHKGRCITQVGAHVKGHNKTSIGICYVGGLPFERTLPWQYKAPFSPSDVLEEYTRPVYIRENGNNKTVEAMVVTIINKARHEDGTAMFSKHDKATLLNEVDPNVVLRVAEKINGGALPKMEEIEKN